MTAVIVAKKINQEREWEDFKIKSGVTVQSPKGGSEDGGFEELEELVLS